MIEEKLKVDYLNKIKITPLMETLRLEKIDDSIYFSEKYNGYISNSRLSLINPSQENDPKAFFEGLSKHNKFGTSLSLGSAVHELVLQPDLFKMGEDINKPTAKMGAMADFLYNKYPNITNEDILEASDIVDYYKGKMTADKIEAVKTTCKPYWEQRSKLKESKGIIYLDTKMRTTALSCVEAITNNKQIQDLLHPTGLLTDPISENEQAILLDVLVKMPKESFTLRLKAKLDNYTIDKEFDVVTVNDIKTLGRILSEFNTNVEKYHYNREIALYSWLLTLCAKKYYGMETCKVKGNYLVVSTIPNFYTKVQALTAKDFKEGFSEFVYLLKLVAVYKSEGFDFEV